MSRRFAGDRLLLATHNAGKAAEIRALLEGRAIEVVTARDLGAADVDETGTTFRENAHLKARALAEAYGAPALGDDSGLEVDALDGAPGIYSARFAGPARDFDAAMRKIAAMIAEKGPDAPRTARFRAVLCLAWPDGEAVFAEGVSEGVIGEAPVGDAGFGYDPIFTPEGEERTYGQMSKAEKARRSHRAKALRAMLAACFD